VNSASTTASSAPVATRSASARPPSTTSSACSRIDFPAPVSPVMTFRPGLERQLELVDDREVADAQRAQHRRS
jgi:hypothetical protein